MLAIVNERQLTEEQVERLELEEMAPEKFDPEIQFKVNKEHSNVKKEFRYRNITAEECAVLMAATKAKWEPYVMPHAPREYETYTREQVSAFMREHEEYKAAKKKVVDEWASLKTAESEVKTATKTKRGKSTKD